MSILVTGVGGYIGSHMVLALLDQNEDMIGIDNVMTGHRDAIPDGATYIHGSLADTKLLQDLFERHDIEDVLCRAGSTSVPEFVDSLVSYYRNDGLMRGSICCESSWDGAWTMRTSTRQRVMRLRESDRKNGSLRRLDAFFERVTIGKSLSHE